MELLVSALRINGDANLDIELMAPDGGELPAYSPGAHIDIRTPSGVLRQYSLCGGTSDRRRYLVCVRREEVSRGGSRSLHEDLRVRARVEVSVPRNLFPLPEAKRYILLSAGIGITPIISMARSLAEAGADFELIHYERSRARVAFLPELTEGPLRLATTLHVGEEGASFRTDLPTCIATPDPETAVLACGPAGLLDLLADRLAAAGWSAEQVYSERFQAEPLKASQSGETSGFEVRIASTGMQFAVGNGETIAGVLQRNGILVDLSCEQGMCGACLTRVLDGVPDHRDIVLSEAERKAGDQITICCSRSRTPVLVLDL